jgi:hypothetical protein
MASEASAQYYYSDIVSTKQINAQYHLLKTSGVKSVELSSFERNSEPTDGFKGSQKIDQKENKVATYTRTNGTGEAFFTAWYNNQDMLVHSIDSSQEAVDESFYEYDAQNKLLLIRTRSHSDNVSTTETHQWQYNENGIASGMTRIRNNMDTLTVTMTLDEKGLVTEEKTFKKKQPQGTVYYYYDTQNRLTDIVRYNLKAKRLLPDYMFEYNENSQLKQMISIPEGSNNYLTWRYLYNEKGLKKMELCYSKDKELLGKVEYVYQ